MQVGAEEMLRRSPSEEFVPAALKMVWACSFAKLLTLDCINFRNSYKMPYA